MPGAKITIKQRALYMSARKEGYTQCVAASKAGISERSGRAIDANNYKQPRQHTWRTRPDPFEDVWTNELVPLLDKAPSLSPLTLLEQLQAKYPDAYPDNLLRTLQRKVKRWKALSGPDKEVIFRQTHNPGDLGLSDFTTLKNITITINGQPLVHLLYHFRLAYSGWSNLKVILGGESYTALAEGLQESLRKLGGAPLEHRTDSLSAAFKNLSADEKKDFTVNYENFCQHYNMNASRNNLGVSHENGGIESPHGHIKRRIIQALLIRGSYDFNSIDEYQEWLNNVVNQHNRRNAKAITIERQALQELPKYKTMDYTEVVTRVTSSSTIDVRRVTYTVPSRLIGEMLRVHLYNDRLLVYLGNTLITTLTRIYSSKNYRARLVDYRHVIASLACKPQAFRHSQLRDDLLPNEQYKQIWLHLDKNMTKKASCKTMVGILHLAATNNCEAALAEDILGLIDANQELSLTKLQTRYQKIATTNSQIVVTQHDLRAYEAIGGYHG